MTPIRHGLTAADRAALASLRAGLAAHPVAITRASYDGLFERVPPADAVDYSESNLGGVPGVWCVPRAQRDRARAALLYLHGGGFVMGSAHAYGTWSDRSPRELVCPLSLRTTALLQSTHFRRRSMMLERRAARSRLNLERDTWRWSAILPEEASRCRCFRKSRASAAVCCCPRGRISRSLEGAWRARPRTIRC